ncbi:hypothetical protein EST38_g10203 [Candolleomyces aberdarensis]|uniref:Uncharacterized protein n=1 Tax=Candolleomyces aberdarensis TaxID=2316362 RepID=A0A4Q2DB73_9AGAR|nr:hypothetical protein EST38_g10203 [Candolleomyces aberdarensis]
MATTNTTFQSGATLTPATCIFRSSASFAPALFPQITATINPAFQSGATLTPAYFGFNFSPSVF